MRKNDERNYGVYDVLNLCDSLGIPMVFDYLHHRAYTGRVSNSAVMKRALVTWSDSDGRPELHYSTQKRRARIGAHADMIDVRDFTRFIDGLPHCTVDIMLEAKAKDRALLKLRRDLQGRYHL